MFTTINLTKTLTGRDVDLALLNRAQSIIETYVGKIEAEIDDANDLALLAKATTYQAVYMQENESIVFEQVALRTAGQGESIVSFTNENSPFIAPLALMACKNLSFKRSRSVYSGKIFQNEPLTKWRNI
jgi:phage gp29-like protein